jgi:hypothetical protein
MERDEQSVWGIWGEIFINRTYNMDPGSNFEVSEVFPDEWETNFDKGERIAMGSAVRKALADDALKHRLTHIEALGVPGPPYHHRYKRRPQ